MDSMYSTGLAVVKASRNCVLCEANTEQTRVSFSILWVKGVWVHLIYGKARAQFLSLVGLVYGLVRE